MILPTYYLDTCVLIGMSKRDYPDAIQVGLDNLKKKIDRRECKVLCSVVTQIELLDVPPEVWEFFDDRFGHFAALTTPVIEVAREIRQRAFVKQEPKTYRLSVADSIHAATAHVYRVEKLYTCDGLKGIVDRNQNATLLGAAPRLASLFKVIAISPELPAQNTLQL